MAADPPPSFPDESTRDRVRDFFSSCGYREAGLRPRVAGPQPLRNGVERRRYLEQRIERFEGTLGALLRTFLLGRTLSAEGAGSILGPEATEDLTASGFLVDEGSSLRPAVMLSPVDDLLIAADLRDRHRGGAVDYVLGPFGVTRSLAACALPGRVSTALDLGCGSGVLGAGVAHRATRVVATDVNPRAVAFTRFNAELNDLPNLDVRQGSLFAPVQNDRFDLILCNPPYVLSPHRTFMYRDGEMGICRRIVRQTPRHLTERGTLQMMVEWPERDRSDWRAEPLSWIDGVPCDAWLLRLYSFRAHEYARHWLEQEYRKPPPEEATASWIEHLERLRAASVGGGLLVLRPQRSSTPVRLFRESPRVGRKGAAETLEGWISAQSLLASLGDPEELLEVPLAPAPGMESVRRRAVDGDGWTESERKLRLSRGFRFEATVDPVIEEIVGFLDGRRTPLEALERFADGHGVEVGPFLPGLPGALCRLLELGLLVPSSDEVP